MVIRNLLIATFLILLVAPMISAQLVYEQGVTFDLKVPCEFNGTYCSVNAVCNLTMTSPNSSVIIDNAQMTNQYAYHNYTILSDLIEDNGAYPATVQCLDQGYNGINTFEILITPNGEIPTTGKSIVDLAMLFALVVALVFSTLGIFYVQSMPAKMALYWCTHFLLIAVTFVAWQTSSGILSYSPFVGEFFRMVFFVVLIAVLPMFLLSIAFAIKVSFINKNVQDLINAGYDQDDAERIALRMAKNE